MTRSRKTPAALRRMSAAPPMVRAVNVSWRISRPVKAAMTGLTQALGYGDARRQQAQGHNERTDPAIDLVANPGDLDVGEEEFC